MFKVTEDLVTEAGITAEKELQSEISRLQNLARLNPSVDQSEIKNLQTHQSELEEALAETRFRLDSLHLVVCENWEFLGLTFQPHINKWTAEASVSF